MLLLNLLFLFRSHFGSFLVFFFLLLLQLLMFRVLFRR